MCRQVGERPRPWGGAAALLGHDAVGRGDETVLDLRRELVKQGMQGGSFFDGYSGAGG